MPYFTMPWENKCPSPGPVLFLSFVFPFQNGISLLVTFNDFAGWATYLYAGETEWTNDFSFFSVIIDLTDAGHG